MKVAISLSFSKTFSSSPSVLFNILHSLWVTWVTNTRFFRMSKLNGMLRTKTGYNVFHPCCLVVSYSIFFTLQKRERTTCNTFWVMDLEYKQSHKWDDECQARKEKVSVPLRHILRFWISQGNLFMSTAHIFLISFPDFIRNKTRIRTFFENQMLNSISRKEFNFTYPITDMIASKINSFWITLPWPSNLRKTFLFYGS